MSDYNIYLRRDGTLTDRFSKMVEEYLNDFEEEITVVTLLNYYSVLSKLDIQDDDLLWAIDRVLQQFMPSTDYTAWSVARSYTPKE